MAKKKQNISLSGPLSWNTIKIYLSGELSDKEMYNLERKIQNEPFEQEAFDGFYDHAPASMENDLDGLREKISRKTGNTLVKKRIMPLPVNWKLVAAVAALVVLLPLAIFLFSKSDVKEPELAQNTSSKTLSKDVSQKDQVQESENSIFTEKDENDVASEESELEMQDSKEEVAHKSSKQNINDARVDVASAGADVSDKSKKLPLKNTPIQVEDDMELETMELVELDLVRDSNIKPERAREPSKTGAVLASAPATNAVVKRDVLDRNPALAPGGLKGYQAYLSANLLSSYPKLTGTYKLKITIAEDGSLSEILILEGLSRRADRKLVKILENAPSWTPANEKGKNISDTATFSLILE